jgi:hypothetical protein
MQKNGTLQHDGSSVVHSETMCELFSHYELKTVTCMRPHNAMIEISHTYNLDDIIGSNEHIVAAQCSRAKHGVELVLKGHTPTHQLHILVLGELCSEANIMIV